MGMKAHALDLLISAGISHFIRRQSLYCDCVFSTVKVSSARSGKMLSVAA